jgi:hypothetical protein
VLNLGGLPPAVWAKTPMFESLSLYLVGGIPTPLKNIRLLGLLFLIYGKMFQTTNQLYFGWFGTCTHTARFLHLQMFYKGIGEPTPIPIHFLYLQVMYHLVIKISYGTSPFSR